VLVGPRMHDHPGRKDLLGVFLHVCRVFAVPTKLTPISNLLRTPDVSFQASAFIFVLGHRPRARTRACQGMGPDRLFSLAPVDLRECEVVET
jgi:hypothetical protein